MYYNHTVMVIVHKLWLCSIKFYLDLFYSYLALTYLNTHLSSEWQFQVIIAGAFTQLRIPQFPFQVILLSILIITLHLGLLLVVIMFRLYHTLFNTNRLKNNITIQQSESR